MAVGMSLHEPELGRYLAVRRGKVARGERPVSNRCLLEDVLGIGGSAMPVVQNIKYVRWFLANLDDLAPLLEVPEALRSATLLIDRWEIIKSAGDVVVAVMASFPVETEVRTASESLLRAEVESQGVDWARLVELLPILVRLITLLEQGEQA